MKHSTCPDCALHIEHSSDPPILMEHAPCLLAWLAMQAPCVFPQNARRAWRKQRRWTRSHVVEAETEQTEMIPDAEQMTLAKQVTP